MLQEEFGIDFTHYKPSTVTRRIERRLALAHSRDIEEYVRRLKSERNELDVLYRDLLIEVTRFFRDEQAFRVLEEQVLPEFLQREPRDAPLRLWVAGCATGEEAYSLAILLQDLMQKLGERPVKIFATDVHRGSLEQATRATYGEEAVAGVSPDRLSRYFIKHGDRYQVVPDVRQMVVFAQHNVIKDAPFTRVDLVTCRNLLIYLQPAAQQKVLSLFHFALTRGGVLFSARARQPARSRVASRSSTSTGGSIENAVTRGFPSTRASIPSRLPNRASRSRHFSRPVDAIRCRSCSGRMTRSSSGSCLPAFS